MPLPPHAGVKMILYVWLSSLFILSYFQDDIPTRAVVAGESSAGGPLYVGRAHHEGGLFPGKQEYDFSSAMLISRQGEPRAQLLLYCLGRRGA